MDPRKAASCMLDQAEPPAAGLGRLATDDMSAANAAGDDRIPIAPHSSATAFNRPIVFTVSPVVRIRRMGFP